MRTSLLPYLFTNKLVYQFTSNHPSHTCDGASKCWSIPRFLMAPANANERTLFFAFQKISDAVGPLNRINDILVAGNHPGHGVHGHARAGWMQSVREPIGRPRPIYYHVSLWESAQDKPSGRTGVVVQGLRMFMQTQVCLVALCMWIPKLHLGM